MVLFAFPRANTPGRTMQACGFRDESPRLSVENVVVLSGSVMTPPTN
ncbi:MAG UNVERIFIED_CONTAM: hypothetical protein LVT10_20590 [Anaerolineae bacterium]